MRIDDYRFGRIVVDGKVFTNDVILLPDGCVISDWWRREGHLLQVCDIEKHLRDDVKVLIVGRGANGCMVVADEVYKWAGCRGMDVVALVTGDAVAEFDRRADEASIAGAFHLTC
ncbi:MAG: hypothetical protein DRP63_01775 [Planctomycetota bacterium]|nr:MAG: hypothetical protein DRP63_01775 [Planctomycetota bacterium]